MNAQTVYKRNVLHAYRVVNFREYFPSYTGVPPAKTDWSYYTRSMFEFTSASIYIIC